MSSTVIETHSQQEDAANENMPPPFYISKEQEGELRLQAGRLSPSLVVDQATSFDEYARQLMVPPAVMDLVRKASNIRLSAWEIEGIRAELKPDFGPTHNLESEGFLRMILKWKAYGYCAEKERLKDESLELEGDDSHPPYIRVACTGKGDFDKLAQQYLDEKYGTKAPE